MPRQLLIQVTINAPSAEDAFDALLTLPESRLAQDATARRLVGKAKARVDHSELRLPAQAHPQEFIDWVAFNLESEEGLLDEDTPAHLKKAVNTAIGLLNDPFQPMACIKTAPASYTFFDRDI